MFHHLSLLICWSTHPIASLWSVHTVPKHFPASVSLRESRVCPSAIPTPPSDQGLKCSINTRCLNFDWLHKHHGATPGSSQSDEILSAPVLSLTTKRPCCMLQCMNVLCSAKCLPWLTNHRHIYSSGDMCGAKSGPKIEHFCKIQLLPWCFIAFSYFRALCVSFMFTYIPNNVPVS